MAGVSVLVLALPLLQASCRSGVSIPQDKVAWKDFPQALASKRLVVIGERHALVEPVETVKYLVSQTGGETRFTHLVMEWSESDQTALNAFMAGDDESWKSMQARTARLPGATVEYFSLFNFVRDFNRSYSDSPVQICLMDVKEPIYSTVAEARDQNMFRHIRQILAASPTNRVLVYVGAAHAAKTGTALYLGDNGEYAPLPTLGRLLAAAYPKELCVAAVLSPPDPLWCVMEKRKNRTATVFRLGETFRNIREYVELGKWWQPEPTNAVVKANEAFDYLICHPTNIPGKRLPATK
jgi:hypothetical protein